jgi:hypothetical protein
MLEIDKKGPSIHNINSEILPLNSYEQKQNKIKSDEKFLPKRILKLEDIKKSNDPHSIEYLSIERKGYDGFDDTGFEFFRHLSEINASDNHLNLNCFKKFLQLVSLNLECNGIESLDKDVPVTTGVGDLQKIAHIQPLQIRDLIPFQALSVLLLPHNSLTHQAFNTLSSLPLLEGFFFFVFNIC